MGTQAAAPAKARAPAPRKGAVTAPTRPKTEQADADLAPELVLRRCACGGSCPRCRGSGAHPPLAINTPGDAFEREADAVADAVMSASSASPSASAAPRALRRCACGGSCPSCRKEKEEEEMLHRDDAGGGGSPDVAPAIVHDVLSSPGRPLVAPAQRFMETRFGADFSGVRVHDDARAAESARAVDAHAYTVGRDIVFASGRYAPGTAGGDRLLAHELAHVVQGAPATLARKEATAPARDLGLRRGSGGERVLRRKVKCTPNAAGKCRFTCPKPPNGPERWCTPAQYDFVQDAEDDSVKVADKAWNNLDAVQNCLGDAPAVGTLLMRHFKVDAGAASVTGHLSTIFDALGKIMSKVGVTPDCEPGASGTTDDTKTRAAWRPLTGDLCFDFYAPYFDPAAKARAPITILHEKAHSLAGKDDVGGYEGDPGYPGKTTAEALRNADSYANFMRDMAALAPAPKCKPTAPSPAQPAPKTQTDTPELQRCACGGSCPSCRKKKEDEALQREDAGGGAHGIAPTAVHEVLASPGRPLPAPARGFMETRFGADFSGIRVHDDARAAESARAVDAHAYTVGRDIVFGAGRYAPGTAAGDRLLAHELAHTLQQGGIARRLQRACGVAAIGTPAGCTPQAAEWLTGYPSYRFDVNCDNFATGERARLIADAATLPANIEVHGYASTDGDPTFNQNLSCARALKTRDALTASAPGGAAIPAARITGVFSHGATAGTAADRMSVVLAPPAPTPTPLPATVPTPGASDFVIERVKASNTHRIYFARGSHALTGSATAAIAALRGSSPGAVRLVGHISDDESATLAQERANEVRTALTANPGGVSVPSATGNPTANVGSSDYSEVRAVEVLTGSALPQRDCTATDAAGNLLNPPVLPCPTLDPDTWTAFNAAWPIAKNAMAAALRAVGSTAGSTPNLPLIDRFFGNHDPTTLAALQTNVPNLDAHVRRLDTITRCGDHCDTGKCAEGWIAYNSNVDAASTMTLCVPAFKELNHVNDQARNLIHESAHGTTPLGGPLAPGEGTKDVAYRHERMLFHLSTADRLRNSDSYALFALFALEQETTGTPGAVPPGIAVPARDNLVGFSPAEEPVISLALARLEKRLSLSADRFGQLYGRADRVRAGSSTWVAGNWATNLMTEAAARFPLTAPPTAPTTTDIRRMAGILERYRRMKSGVATRALTVTRVPAGVVSWTSGGTGWFAGSSLEVGREFFRATADDQVSLLMEALAGATRDVETAYVPAYVSLAGWIQAHP